MLHGVVDLASKKAETGALDAAKVGISAGSSKLENIPTTTQKRYIADPISLLPGLSLCSSTSVFGARAGLACFYASGMKPTLSLLFCGDHPLYHSSFPFSATSWALFGAALPAGSFP